MWNLALTVLSSGGALLKSSDPSHHTRVFFLPSVVQEGVGRKFGLAGEMRSRMAGTTAVSLVGDEVSICPTLNVKQTHALTQQLHPGQHV